MLDQNFLRSTDVKYPSVTAPQVSPLLKKSIRRRFRNMHFRTTGGGGLYKTYEVHQNYVLQVMVSSPRFGELFCTFSKIVSPFRFYNSKEEGFVN